MPTTQESVRSPIGHRTPRVDGPLKVSGGAMYTSDFKIPGALFAVPVPATIGSGRIEKLDTQVAQKMPGVRAIFHRGNIGKISRAPQGPGVSARMDERRPPLEDDVIRYYGQYVALVIADTLQTAQAAARAVHVTFRKDTVNIDSHLEPEEPIKIESQRGESERGFLQAPIKIDATYVTPVETHNPIELHSTTASWEGDSLTIYESTQAVVNHAEIVSLMFGLPMEKVRVISKFLGSGFGGKLWPWTHSILAAAASRSLRKPVKLVISRQMMFQAVGHRPLTQQRIRLGAASNGKLISLQHDYISHTSILDDYKENCGEATPFIYSVPNLKVTSSLARRNVGTPTSMRGPGAVPGLFALESAMDELAIDLKMDPVQLRHINEPKIDEGLQIPFSSRHLTECLTTGAEKFGWAKRNPQTGSMRRDGLILGWGMAACTWIADRFPCEATVEVQSDGTAKVSTATQDIGTGTYTVLAQIVSERLGLPLDKVQVVLGDTDLPPGPISGGSMVTASVIPAVLQAADVSIIGLLSAEITAPGSQFLGLTAEQLILENGMVRAKDSPQATGVSFRAILKSANLRQVSGSGKSGGTFGQKPKLSSHSYGAHFVEVTWQPEIARLRISRVVTVIDAGKILNPLAGRNQIEGAVVMGIGMALFEHTIYDARSGAPVNRNFADYVVSTNADAPPIEVHFLDYPDKNLNAIGARGIGEIGLAGVAAAIANAVYHATGVRVRQLPIRIEDLIA